MDYYEWTKLVCIYPRACVKSSRILDESFLYLTTKGKKKKAFLKFIYAYTKDLTFVKNYEKYIKSNNGKVPYCWHSFRYYQYIIRKPITGRSSPYIFIDEPNKKDVYMISLDLNGYGVEVLD